MDPVAATERLNFVESEGVSRVLTDDRSSGNSRKRKLALISNLSHQATFPRKRSATACQLCRTRKTKCDNQRPTCSKCCELGAHCIYQDQANPTSPASQILHRLEYLIDLVESGVPTGLTTNCSGDTPTIAPEERDTVSFLLESDGRVQNAYPQSTVTKTDSTTSDIAQDKDTRVPGQEYFGSSEDILGWPVFEGKYDRRWIEALIFDPTLLCDDLCGPPTSPRVTDDSIRDKFEDPRSKSKMGPGVCEEDVPNLVETFLLNVHVKNPIFDPEYLRKMARTVVDGTWLMARQSFTSALLLLAARRSGIHEIPEEQYEESVQSSLSTLRFWEDEAPDLKASRLVLEDIVQQLHTSMRVEHPVSY